MKVGPVLAFLLPALSVAGYAQGDVSLGVGVGTVRYSGGTRFSVATLAPAAQFVSPRAFAFLAASLSPLPGGAWAGQGRLDLWAAAPGVPAAVSAGLSGSTRSDGLSSAAGHLIGEAIAHAGSGGAAAGAGVVGGKIEGAPGATALRFRVRGWWPAGPAQLSLAIEPTRLAGAWYAEVTGGASWDRGRTAGSLWAVARARTGGATATGGVTLQYFLSRHVAVEVGAGGFLADPFQGLPRSGYVSAGVRVRATPRSPVPKTAALIAMRRGDSVVVRVRMGAAASVAIAGDWTTWRAEPLRPAGDGIWEGTFALAAGTYHFSLLVDGMRWGVPAGVATVPDGLGGVVAVLTVL